MADAVEPKITPEPVPDGPRRRTQASTKLLHEWASMQQWDSPPVYECRLGPTPLHPQGLPVTPAVAEMLRRSNRYADLIGPMGNELLVVESKVVLSPDAIGQLLAYLPLVASSPIRDRWSTGPIRGVILCAVDDPHVHELAELHGLRVELYSPAWVAEYLSSKYFRR